VRIKYLLGNMKGRDHLNDPCVDVRTIHY